MVFLIERRKVASAHKRIVVIASFLICISVCGCSSQEGDRSVVLAARNLPPLSAVWNVHTDEVGEIQVEGDRILVYASKPPYEYRVECFDRKDGKKQWVHGGISRYCTNIAVYEEMVIAIDQDNNPIVLDAKTGTLIDKLTSAQSINGQTLNGDKSPWRKRITGLSSTGAEIVWITGGGEVTVYDMRNRVERWRRSLSNTNDNYLWPPIAAKSVIVLPEHNLYVLNSQDGIPLWSRPTNLIGCLVREDALYEISSNAVSRVETNTGKTIWSRNTSERQSGIAAVDSRHLVVTSEKHNGGDGVTILCIRSSDGSLKWKITLDESSISADGIAIWNGVTYLMAISGNLYAIDCQTGKGLAGYETGAKTYNTGISTSQHEVVCGGHYDHIYSFRTLPPSSPVVK